MFYTGSYTQQGAPAAHPTGKGIGCFELDGKSGALTFVCNTVQRSPSYLVISKDKTHLYAVEEMYENLNPLVHAYKIEKEGKLRLLNTQKIHGDYACHLAIIQDRLLIACYVSGNILSYPILKDGRLAPCEQEIKHKGIGHNKERQEAPHPHMIYPFHKEHLYAVDLTLDIAKAYRLDSDTKLWQESPSLDIKIDKGCGARHMVMHSKETFAFILGELTGEIVVADLRSKESKIVQKISIVPNIYHGEIGGAAIRMHPGGKYLYASNRGSDSIAIFKVDKATGKLSLVAHQPTEGKAPRDFNIDPTGTWLVVANQDSNTLVVFKINSMDGTLDLNSKINVETPVNICWK